MNKLTGIALALAMILTLATAHAQQAGPRGGQTGAQAGQGPRGGGMMRRMAEMNAKILAQLNLSNDQKAKVKKLDEATAKKMKDLMESAKGGDRSQMREKFRAINEDHRKGLMEILTPDQEKKYQELWKEEMKKWRESRPGGNREGGRPGTPPPAN